MIQRSCLPQQRRADEVSVKRHDEHVCKKCGVKPGKAMLRCANGRAISNLVTIPLPGGGFSPVPLGSVTIDTDNLCNPTILFTASGRITTIAALAIGTPIEIRVTKICKGVSQVIGTLDLTPVAAALLLNDSFTLQVCDSNSCECECVTYNLEFVPGGAIAITAGLAINNIVLSALAVEKEC